MQQEQQNQTRQQYRQQEQHQSTSPRLRNLSFANTLDRDKAIANSAQSSRRSQTPSENGSTQGHSQSGIDSGKAAAVMRTIATLQSEAHDSKVKLEQYETKFLNDKKKIADLEAFVLAQEKDLKGQREIIHSQQTLIHTQQQVISNIQLQQRNSR
jgi:predicted extracellular nuclease